MSTTSQPATGPATPHPAGADPAYEVTEVAVLGSCATRDNFNRRFNPDYAQTYHCGVAANQASLIALMAPPVDPEIVPLDKMSDYDRWNLHSDFSREFLTKIVEQQPWAVIVDFFGDVHFGVLRLADGGLVTNNRWKLWKTQLYRDAMERGDATAVSLWDDLEEYLALWRDAADRFGEFMREHCPDTRIIVHRGLNLSTVHQPNNPHPVGIFRSGRLRRVDVARANELWAMLDDYAIEAWGAEVIDLRDGGFASVADHPWGPYVVHYQLEYYPRFLAELHLLWLEDHADARTVELARAVNRSWQALHAEQTERFRRRLALQRRRITSLNARLDEATAPGPVRRVASGVRRRAGRARRALRRTGTA